MGGGGGGGGGAIYPRNIGRGCQKFYRERGASFPEGGPIFVGKIAWGCQISWGAKFPVTPYIL